MFRWSPDRSAILSLLLNEVTGTPEVIQTRQDFCMLQDALVSSTLGTIHFTGSKAEGLDLPGSDTDLMFDFNRIIPNGLKVIQSFSEPTDTSQQDVFCICTENVNPCFALLRCTKSRVHNTLLNQVAVERMNGIPYLSSKKMADFISFMLNFSENNLTISRQGPSVEYWFEYKDRSESGTDCVPSIHCQFWPDGAAEWLMRPRYHGWPKPHDIRSIVNFGCHLVPVGHPQSALKFMEWRFSFSVAERVLVWSFNHTQMQCYAVMKIVLKEFIKERCSQQNQVLCSYFIKTFLFWKYETTNLNFWCENNSRECIIFLLQEFSKILHNGLLKHYFIPTFNLLSVKLTREARTELLQLFDIILQHDISIFQECNTLRTVWSKFLSAYKNQMSIINSAQRRNFLMNDEILVEKIRVCDIFNWGQEHVLNNLQLRDFTNTPLQIDQNIRQEVLNSLEKSLDFYISLVQKLPCKTCLKSIVLRRLFFEKALRSAILTKQNRDTYRLKEIVLNESLSFDLSTCKIWYALVVLSKKDYMATLSIVNQLLSRIPSFALMYKSASIDVAFVNFEARQLYIEKFFNSTISTMQRARKAWFLGIILPKYKQEILPLAFSIELHFCDSLLNYILITPYICLYYLKFLCHNMLRQYGERDSTLHEFIDYVNNSDQCECDILTLHHSYNIAGHCLLMAGEPEQARGMFTRSYRYTQTKPPWNKYNSALWYLQNFC